MKRRLLFAILGLLIGSACVIAQSNVWNEFQPLRSTKSDLEKKLTLRTSEPQRDHSVYDFEGLRIQVEYSERPCDEGWNVPVGTVLWMEVQPAKGDSNKSAAELKIDEKDFFISGDDAFFATWTNPELGIQYYFGNISQTLHWKKYIPRRSDNVLRCRGFPPFVPEGQHYAFESLLFFDPSAGKDGGFDALVSVHLVSTLVRAKESGDRYTAYVIVYFDKDRPLNFYARRLAQFRKNASWMSRNVGGGIQIIEGGLAFENRIYFYLLPKKYPPPAPEPQLPSPQFMKRTRR